MGILNELARDSEPAPAVTTYYRLATDDKGVLVPCQQPVPVSGWLFSNNVWTFVDACEGHGLGLAQRAGSCRV